jgi:hypothetical protein
LRGPRATGNSARGRSLRHSGRQCLTRSGEGKIAWDLEAGGRGRRMRVRRLLIPAACDAAYYIGVIGPHDALTAAHMAKRAEMPSQQWDKPRGQIAALTARTCRQQTAQPVVFSPRAMDFAFRSTPPPPPARARVLVGLLYLTYLERRGRRAPALRTARSPALRTTQDAPPQDASGFFKA